MFPDRRSGPVVPADSLIAPLPAAAKRLLEGYRKVLAEVLPLPPRHLRELPGSIRRLSRELTAERSEGFAPKYMSDPVAVSAYCHYFLPWNLYRLVRLFTGIGPLLPELGDGDTVVDLGAGPLTAVQALWIARPELRSRRLRIHAVDRAMKPLSVGLALFDALRGPDRTWDVRLTQGPLTTRLPERAKLLMTANVLNESTTLGREDEERVSRLAHHLAMSLDPREGGGKLLLVEPGTRAGGQIVSLLRRELSEEGLFPLAPCGHAARCPFPGTGARSWCHFAFDVADAPAWLQGLTRKAGMEKEEATMAFLLAGEGEPPHEGRLRVVSRSFAVEGPHGRTGGVYACGEKGLALLTGGRFALSELKPGTGVDIQIPEDSARDPRSGARIIELGIPRGSLQGAAGSSEAGESGSRFEARRGGDARPGPKGGRKVDARAASGKGTGRAADAAGPPTGKHGGDARPGSRSGGKAGARSESMPGSGDSASKGGRQPGPRGTEDGTADEAWSTRRLGRPGERSGRGGSKPKARGQDGRHSEGPAGAGRPDSGKVARSESGAKRPAGDTSVAKGPARGSRKAVRENPSTDGGKAPAHAGKKPGAGEAGKDAGPNEGEGRGAEERDARGKDRARSRRGAGGRRKPE